MEEDLVKAVGDYDEDKLEILKNHSQLNYVQQQVNRIGKNLLVGEPVAWYRQEGEDLCKQAEGDETVPLDLAPEEKKAGVKKGKKGEKRREKRDNGKKKKER